MVDKLIEKKDIVLENIFNRKSVRSFVRGKKVSNEDLQLLVRVGMAAPTSKNSQPWAFIVIDDDDVIEEMAKAIPFAEMIKDAGSAIVLVSEILKSDPRDPMVWTQDLAAATENILLAVEAMGLGACWCQAYNLPDRVEMVSNFFQLPKEVIPFNIICIGHPAGFDQKTDKWNPRKMFRNKWTSAISNK